MFSHKAAMWMALLLPLLAACRAANPVSTPAPASLEMLEKYAFPQAIDPAKRYLFYLHGKIVEDQGLPAVSPDYGEYQYLQILEVLAAGGFEVISEARPRDADGYASAQKVAGQVQRLLDAGVAPRNITVTGASKGAGIAAFSAHLLDNPDLNFVFLGLYTPDALETFRANGFFLHGNVLCIYDSVDEYASSCRDLFALSEGRGLSRHEEIILQVGTGHGILYTPLDEWVVPTLEWAARTE